jgi:hypothetical protein
MFKLKTFTSIGKTFRGDAGLLREALHYIGVERNYGDTIFSDGNKHTRRLKIWMAGNLFNASNAQKKMFMERLKFHFGNRVVKYGHWVSTSPYCYDSFYIVLTEDLAVKAEREQHYAIIDAAAQARLRARLLKQANNRLAMQGI